MATERLKRVHADLWSGLALMILSAFVIREALDLEIGTPVNPGSGFMVLGAGAALGLLALRQVIMFLAAPARATECAAERIRWVRIVAVIVAIVLYILTLRPVGYLASTFLLLSVLFQIMERGHWVARTIGAAGTSLATYVVFAKMLQLNLPRGLIVWF